MSFSRHSRYLIFLVPALVFFCTLPGFSQNTTVVWSDPVLVSDSSQNAASPRIELNAAGEPLVLWGSGGSTAPAIRLARWQNGNFLPAQTLGTGNIASDLYGFDELDLATRGDTVFVAFENVEQGIYLLRATDGGLSFSGPTTVFTPAGGRIVTLPAVVADAAGNPLVSYLYELSSWSNAQFHLARSTDGGLSFETPVIASAPADGDFVCECCASDIVTRGDS
ncbi:MAG: hypothetical protein JNK89_11480, partial [Saprospiraceae bacterium]|nr:hypothetical protein [Saprospiraceae bacterium]